MDWIQSMQNAIDYMEENILDNLSAQEIAEKVYSSSTNFQRIFSIITGMTVGDYIRSRRLTLAGQEIVESNDKIIQIAIKYGYDTAESFTKAFLRFHGMTPSAAKKSSNNLKNFAPLSIQINIRGGFNMQRKIIPNIPVINYDGNNAAFFITLLMTTLQGIGEECDRAKLVALSGEGNRFCWTDGEWVFGNETTESINETPFETEYRVLTAVGWRCKYITVQRDKDMNYMNTNQTQIRQDFIDAIDRGFPVLIRYLKHADCDINVFFGYESDGQKIIGFNYNNGYTVGVSQPIDGNISIAWDNWENNIAGYILFQHKEESATERNTALSTFRFISEHARKTSEIRGKKIGFSAWESFLHHLEFDDFNELSLSDVSNRFIIYCDAPLPYYQALAECFPEWRDELEAAIAALEACASYGGFLWSQGFTFDEVGYEKFRKHEARKILADAGREAMHKDIEAVEQFESILRKEKLL
jgi:AraC-like DNA-binding protein